MAKKQLKKRLEALFSELSPQGETSLALEATTIQGWTWAVDAQGRYTHCSSEVEAVLGIPSERFVGQPFTSFALAPESAGMLERVLHSEHLPTSLTAAFMHADGSPRWVRMHIYLAPEGGWRGVAEVLIGETPASAVLAPEADLLPRGVRLEKGRIVPADRPLTPVAEQAIRQGDSVVVSGNGSLPAAMAVPMRDQERVVGVLELLDPTRDRSWTEDDRLLVEQVADQLTLALENARLFQQTQAALAETEHLYRASAALNVASSYTEVLEALRAHSVLGEGSHNVSLNLFNRPWKTPEDVPEWVFARARWTQLDEESLSPRYPLAQFPAARLLRPEQPLVVEDVAADPRLDEATRALYLQRFRGGSTVFFPLNVGGEWIGYINAIYPQPRTFSEADLRRTMALVSQAAVSVQNLRLIEETQRRAEQLQTAAEIARDTTSASLELDTLLNRAVNLIRERFGYYHASIFLLDEQGAFVRVRASTGEAGAEMVRRKHRLAVGSQSVIGQTTATGQPVVVNDVTDSTIHRPNPLLPETRAEVGIPMKIGDQVIGAIDVQSTHPYAFSEDDIQVLQILADQLAVAVENARAYELAQQAVAEMQEADRLKSQFLANMSHELRTPLNSIIGFSRVILKGIDGPINEMQEQDLTAIYNAGQHLLTLINDILDLSKIEAGKMELSFEDVNLNDLINSVMSTAKGLVKDKPVELRLEVDPNLPIVHADPVRVRQVLLNLLSNAAKFTEQGSITIKAYPRKGPRGPEVYIAVADTGPGIALEDRAKLFKPFSQVDDSPTRKTGGTGLGLSICRSLVEMHHGVIDVESEVGKGSTFWFTLPLQPELRREDFPPDARVVLAIEDNPDIVNLYARYLNPEGYQVVPLTDPNRAVERARELRPVAITLDVLMPEKDGWTVLQELKSDPETRHIPVIMCTILAEEEKGFSLGAADYLIKPILADDLVRAIKRLNQDGSIHKVLVVDDDPNDRRLLQKVIEESGDFVVITADGGQQALERLKSEAPDVMVIDLFMPEMDGFTLLETMRADPQWCELPVIVLTGGDLTTEQRARLTEFNHQMMQKGLFDQDRLIGMLRRALQRLQPTTGAG